MSNAVRDDATAGRGGWGPSLCILGFVVLAFTFTDLPPKFENLVASDVQVTRAPYIKLRMSTWDFLNAVEDFIKGGWNRVDARQYEYPALDLDGTTAWIATAGSHRFLPRELAGVRAGDRIKVWIDVPSRQVWQVAFRNTTLMAYEDIERRDAHWRHTFRYVAFGVFLVGVVLAVLKL